MLYAYLFHNIHKIYLIFACLLLFNSCVRRETTTYSRCRDVSQFGVYPNINHQLAADMAGHGGVKPKERGSRAKIPGVPDYGWRVKLDHEFQEDIKPFVTPRLRQVAPLVGLSLRYGLFWLKKRREGKRIFIDQVKVVPYQPIYGAPVGGIGCGTIGRGFRGEFCRFQMVPGIYQWHVVEANQFTVCVRRKGQTVYQQVLSPHRPKGPGLTAWNWAFHGEYATYHALYPRSWTTYDLPGQNIRLICRQVSPVFPHDYKDTSLPAAAFIWSIENQGSEPVDVSIMFTFKNGQGIREDKKGGVWNEPFESTHNATKVSGVMIHQTFKEMGCTYAVAASHREGVQVSHKVSFDPNSPAVNVWRDLLEDGELDSCPDPSPKTSRGQELATAVCAKCHVKPQSTQQMDFSLTWDMPVIYFGAKEQLYCRRYTRWFGSSGNASPHLASHTLNNYHIWEKKIDEWQKPIVQNRHLPDWYKSALFNELYFVSDGGTVWVDKMAHKNGFQDSKADTPPRAEDSQKDARDNPLEQEYGKFGYLEGQEYRMYNTYDVHYYASFALIMLWPKLQLSLQYDLAMDIPREDLTRFKFCMDGNVDVVKAKNCVPHDVGDPEDEPWIRTNCYAIHATHDWKDLNPKFVLQVYRDYHITKDHAYMKSMYPCAKAVTDSCLRFDHDGDGLIENGGFADQTYDSWSMTGASAYCGGLWLASLHLMCLMARQLGYYGDEKKYKEILDKGKISFERKLWNGQYYNYDSAGKKHSDSIMADQLCGHWYLKASGVADDTIFPADHVKTALRSIYKYNVLPFKNGTMGAVNGARPSGKADTCAVQSEEFWTGVNYALAASMIQEGMLEEGFKVAQGAYHTLYESWGLGFQTPEAYFENNRYRSLGYMRPLSIWAMQWALEKYHPELMKGEQPEAGGDSRGLTGGGDEAKRQNTHSEKNI